MSACFSPSIVPSDEAGRPAQVVPQVNDVRWGRQFASRYRPGSPIAFLRSLEVISADPATVKMASMMAFSFAVRRVQGTHVADMRQRPSGLTGIAP